MAKRRAKSAFQPPEGPEDTPAKFAADLKKLVRASGKAQNVLAARCGVTPPSVNRWLSGTALPRPEYLRRLVRNCGGNVAEWTKRREDLVTAGPSSADTRRAVKTFGNALKLLVQSRGLRYIDLLEVTGAGNKSTIGEWLTGNHLPPRAALVAIVEYCGGDATMWIARWEPLHAQVETRRVRNISAAQAKRK